MKSLYKAFVLPHLEYCSPLLLGVGKTEIKRIEDANFYILRSLLRCGKSVSYNQLLSTAKMNTLEHRRICQSLILLYKSLSCHAPGYIRNFFNFKETNYRHLRGHGGVNLSLPKFNLKWINNSYTYKVAKIWMEVIKNRPKTGKS